jgi:PAS domain S-box-containing protein
MRELAEHRQLQSSLQEAKAEIEDAKHLLQSVVDTAPVRIFWKDRQLNYLGCNPIFAQDAGKQAPAEVIGGNDYQMIWAPQADLYRADDLRVIQTGQAKLNYEEPQTTPEGATIWLRSSKVPLKGRQGETIGVLGVYDDITDRKAAVEALRQSEHKFHSLYSAMTEGVALHELVFDADGHRSITDCSTSIRPLKRFSASPGRWPSGVVPARSTARRPSSINLPKWH